MASQAAKMADSGHFWLPSGYTDTVHLWEAPIAASAHRHGIADEISVMLCATSSPSADVTLFLGPDRAVSLIEVGVLATDDGPLIIHAMPARTGRFQPPKE